MFNDDYIEAPDSSRGFLFKGDAKLLSFLVLLPF